MVAIKKNVSIIVPTYNEERLLEKTIKHYYSYLKKLKKLNSFEIIICINGSTDNTEKIAKKLSVKYKEVKYVITKEKGIGIGIIIGMKKANKDLVAIMPADGEYEIQFIEKAIKKMNNYDFVIGSRRKATYAGKKFFRKILSYGFNFTLAIFLSSKVSEAASVKMFKKKWMKKVVNEFKNHGFEWQIEIMYYALRDKLNITSVPGKTFANKPPGQSSVNIVKATIVMLLSTIKYGLKYRMGQILG